MTLCVLYISLSLSNWIKFWRTVKKKEENFHIFNILCQTFAYLIFLNQNLFYLANYMYLKFFNTINFVWCHEEKRDSSCSLLYGSDTPTNQHRERWEIKLEYTFKNSNTDQPEQPIPAGKTKRACRKWNFVKHILNIITIIDPRQNYHSNTPFQILLFWININCKKTLTKFHMIKITYIYICPP